MQKACLAVGFNSLIYMVVSKNWGIPKTDGVYPHLFWTPPLLTKLMGYQRSITGHHRTLFFFWGLTWPYTKSQTWTKKQRNMSLKNAGATFGENTDWLKPHWWFYIDSAEGITSNDVKDRGTYLKIKLVILDALFSIYLLVGSGTVCSWSKMLFIEKSNVDQHLHLHFYTILLGDFHFHVQELL